MKVRAIRRGYFNTRLKEGDYFDIPTLDAFSFIWMEPAKESDWQKVRDFFEIQHPKKKITKLAGFEYPEAAYKKDIPVVKEDTPSIDKESVRADIQKSLGKKTKSRPAERKVI